MRISIMRCDSIETLCDFPGIDGRVVTLYQLRAKVASALGLSPEEQAAFYLDYNNKDISHPAYDELPLTKVLGLASVQHDTPIAMVFFYQPPLTQSEFDCLTKKQLCDFEGIVHNRRVMLAAVLQNGTALEYANNALRADREIVMAAVQQNGQALKYAAHHFKSDPQIVLAAITKQPDSIYKDYRGAALRHADCKLRGQAEIVQAAVESNGQALEYAAVELKDTKHLVYLAVKNCGEALKHASRRLQGDPEIIKEAVRNDYKVFSLLPQSVQNTDLVIAALEALNQMPAGQRKLHWGLFMKNFPHERFCNDVEFMRVMVQRKDNTFYRSPGPDVLQDYEFVFYALQRDGRLLQKIPAIWRDDQDTVLRAVQENGSALQYASEALCHNRVVQLVALNSCWEKSLPFPYDKVSVSCEHYLKNLNHAAVQFALDNLRKAMNFSGLEYANETAKQPKPLIEDEVPPPKAHRCGCWPRRFF